jgi:hypothetical protein
MSATVNPKLIIVKKRKIKEQDTCDISAKKRKMGKELTYSKLENVLFA